MNKFEKKNDNIKFKVSMLVLYILPISWLMQDNIRHSRSLEVDINCSKSETTKNIEVLHGYPDEPMWYR